MKRLNEIVNANGRYLKVVLCMYTIIAFQSSEPDIARKFNWNVLCRKELQPHVLEEHTYIHVYIHTKIKVDNILRRCKTINLKKLHRVYEFQNSIRSIDSKTLKSEMPF